MTSWTTWPMREALVRGNRSQARTGPSRLIRIGFAAAALWGVLADGNLSPWQTAVVVAGLIVAVAIGWAYFRVTLDQQLWPSVALLAVLVGGGLVAHLLDGNVAASVLWCGSAVLAIERLPLMVGVTVAGVSLVQFGLFSSGDGILVTGLISTGLALAGYSARLDAEARGSADRLLAQERAARTAEAKSAALAERARIAREIHDVLAHSLSAQTVHLEATRLLIERGADRDVVLERVVAARRMAREGLAETRQALSALRGDMAPVEEFLRELLAAEGARLEVRGEPRGLPAEAGLAVRRVAQEAMTNVRKHAPGASVALTLEYRPEEVEMEFRDFGGKRPVDNSLGASGAGYGLRGMRERAELLGGALDAGPAEEGFVVRLRVPA